MSRYSIALKKTPRETEKETLVTQFGFNQDIKSSRRQTFFVRAKEINRVGILFDDPSTIFYCSKVHYFKSHRFFCKSTPGHVGYCCQPEYQGRKPVLRIATIVVQYHAPQSTGPEDKVLPWIFGTANFEKIKEFNEMFPVDKHDLLIKCPGESAYRFKQYELMPTASSLWQDSESKNRILELHSQLKRNIRSYFAEEYSDADISSIISQPETPSPSVGPGRFQLNVGAFPDNLEPQPPPLRRIELPDDFWEGLASR